MWKLNEQTMRQIGLPESGAKDSDHHDPDSVSLKFAPATPKSEQNAQAPAMVNR
jgi:hypothetical protein